MATAGSSSSSSSSDEEAGLEHRSTTQKIRYILADDDDDDFESIRLGQHPLFTQMDVLVHFDGGQYGWKEISRWLKYEERVEVGGRWSKPHVATSSMRGLQAVRQSLASGQCCLGLSPSSSSSQSSVADAVVTAMKGTGGYEDDICSRVRQLLLAPHKHKDRQARKSKSSDGTEKSRFRRRSGQGHDIGNNLYSYPPGTDPSTLQEYKPNKRLQKKLPKTCEAANILVGQADFLTHQLAVFCRLGQPTVMGDLTEVALPTRFLFLVLEPTRNASDNAIWQVSEMGRAVASLLGDKVFCEVAYKAKSRRDLLEGVDEYIEDLTVLPPSVWDPQTRLAPPASSISMDKVMLRLDESKRGPSGPTAPPQEEGASNDQTLLRTGRIFGGLINDVKRCYNPKVYASMIKDGLHMQCLATIVFLFFACISPIVTFGGLMGEKTDGHMGTIEMLLAGAICGFCYAIFSGQPLTIIGATGPLMVFEAIVCQLCETYHIHFLSFRVWIGAWIALFLLLVVMFDLSALVRYITRFTEESFAILISIIFMYEAFTKTFSVWMYNPVHIGTVRELPDQPWHYQCYCVPNNYTLLPVSNITAVDQSMLVNTTKGVKLRAFSNWTYELNENCITFRDRIEVSSACLSEKHCLSNGWNLTGDACFNPIITHSAPDVFLLSVFLFLGTFGLALTFRNFRTSRFFPSIVRGTVADFAVFLSVTIWTSVDYMFGIDTPKLNVPAEFKPTRSDRGWLISPATTYWWLIPAAAVPALLGTILIFLDQQITCVIVNRKEHKLKKPHGYHLDLFVLSLLIIVCSILGLPWFVAATVRSVTHVRSLLKESEVKIPGEKIQIVGAREQRVTGIFIHILIGLSTLLTSFLRLIPMPVLYGVFLYMGFTSLSGVQFFERMTITLMPVKYQPDYIYLRHVKLRRVHLFTFVQFVCFVLMWAIKSIKTTSIGFPLMLLALMGIRKLMDYVFTQTELYWLDHMLPGEERIKLEDDKNSRHGANAGNNSSEVDVFLQKEKEALGKYSENHESIL